MGSELVKFALANFGDLSERAKLVLVTMAVYALDNGNDDHPGGLYFGGWVVLAVALGYAVPDHDPDDKDVIKQRRNAEEAVRRAVAELVARGAVEPLIEPGKVHTGSRQNYRLHVFRPLARRAEYPTSQWGSTPPASGALSAKSPTSQWQEPHQPVGPKPKKTQ